MGKYNKFFLTLLLVLSVLLGFLSNGIIAQENESNINTTDNPNEVIIDTTVQEELSTDTATFNVPNAEPTVSPEPSLSPAPTETTQPEATPTITPETTIEPTPSVTPEVTPTSEVVVENNIVDKSMDLPEENIPSYYKIITFEEGTIKNVYEYQTLENEEVVSKYRIYISYKNGEPAFYESDNKGNLINTENVLPLDQEVELQNAFVMPVMMMAMAAPLALDEPTVVDSNVVITQTLEKRKDTKLAPNERYTNEQDSFVVNIKVDATSAAQTYDHPYLIITLPNEFVKTFNVPTGGIIEKAYPIADNGDGTGQIRLDLIDLDTTVNATIPLNITMKMKMTPNGYSFKTKVELFNDTIDDLQNTVVHKLGENFNVVLEGTGEPTVLKV